MPRFVRVSSVDNQYRTLFQNKSQFETVNGDIYARATFMAEDTPVGYCDEAAKDLNWFLAVGGREATINSCQIGISYDVLAPVETMIFPGSYTYSIRSKKNITRQAMEFYTRKDYVPLPPLSTPSYTFTTVEGLFRSPSYTYTL